MPIELVVSTGTPRCLAHASWCSLALVASKGAMARGGSGPGGVDGFAGTAGGVGPGGPVEAGGEIVACGFGVAGGISSFSGDVRPVASSPRVWAAERVR